MARKSNAASLDAASLAAIRLDDLGDSQQQVGPESAGQSGDNQGLSDVEDASDASVDELMESDQAFEAGIVDGVEDAANHPERPVHTHAEYRRPEDIAPERGPE